MRVKEAPKLSNYEWYLFALRWVLLILFSAGLYLARTQTGHPDPFAGVGLAFGIGAVAYFLTALFMLVPYIPAVYPALALADIVTAAAFMSRTIDYPILSVGIAIAIMVAGVLQLGVTWGSVQIIGTALALGVMLTLENGNETAAVMSTDYALPMVVLAGVIIVVLGGLFMLDTKVGVQSKLIEKLRRGETAELEHQRQRARVFYDLTATIGSTIDTDKILNAALDAGRIGARSETTGMSSAILLFRPKDDQMHVVTSRRFTRQDENMLVPGKTGVIAQSLRDGTPVLLTSSAKDPELQHFSSLLYCKSLICVPLRAGYDSFGVMVYGSDRPDTFDTDVIDLLTAVGRQTTIALQNSVLYNSLVEEKERILDVEEDARKKLARDLHDGPTQSVAAIAMRMSYIYKLMEKNPAGVPDELRKVEDIARKTVKDIRHMLFTLRPLILESQGLAAALSQLAEKVHETHGQAVSTRVGQNAENALDQHHQGVIFYIVEEAVNNARKHAQAEMISVNVGLQDDVVIVQIADNGVGFNTTAVDTNYEQRGSLGMVNMRERAALLDGTLQIESVPGKGTKITVIVPIKNGGHNGSASPVRGGGVAISPGDRYNPQSR